MQMHLTSKGQVTIPKHIRETLGVAPHDAVEFHVKGGKVYLTKPKKKSVGKKTKSGNRFDALIGIGEGTLTTDEIMRLTRGDDWQS